MPELVTIPISYFEFVVEYARPEWKLLADRVSVMKAIFDSLKPWNPNTRPSNYQGNSGTNEAFPVWLS